MYGVGTPACLFGIHLLTGRILDEILSLISYRDLFELVKEGIEDALDCHASCIGDGSETYGAELGDLSEAATILDHKYANRN